MVPLGILPVGNARRDFPVLRERERSREGEEGAG